MSFKAFKPLGFDSVTTEKDRLNQILLREAQNAQHLLESFEQEFWNPETNFFYVISSKWLTEWKQHTSYDNVIKGNQLDDEYFGKGLLSKINKDIVSKDRYIITYPDEEEEYLNVVLKNGIEEKKDYQLITEAAWKYFADRYEHITVKRPAYVLPNGEKVVEVMLKQIYAIPVYNSLFTEIKNYHRTEFIGNMIQSSAYKTIRNFKSDLLKDSKSKSAEEHQASQDKLRMFLLDPAIDLQSYFLQVRVASQRAVDDNYKIEFRGQYLEKDLCLKLGEAIADEDVVFIDTREDENKWTFYGDGAYVVANCDCCSQYGELKFVCRCKQVFYCTKECQIKDESVHQENCPG